MTYPKTKYSILSLLLVLSFTLTSCLDSTNSGQNVSNLLETAKEVTNNQSGEKALENYVDLLEQTELDSTIANEGPFTAVIPIDSAFTDIAQNKLDALSGENLTQAVEYHLVDGIVNLNGIQSEEQIESLQGDDLYFKIVSDITGSSAFVNGGQLLGQINASNGIIYVVDQVLFQDKNLEIPGLINKRSQLDSLSTAISNADLNETLANTDENFTVFAPSDESFDDTQLSSDDIQYHVIPEKLLSRDLNTRNYTTLNGQQLSVKVDGSTITINGNATIQTDDIEGTNGVVHIIDSVLEPSAQ